MVTAKDTSGTRHGGQDLPEIPATSARPTPNLTWHEAARERLTFGDRAADRLRQAMGSWRFVGIFFAVMALWWVLNTVAGAAWDPYPFILLNLFLSMLAGVQGAILLIAAKRQDTISAALAQHDFNTNLAAKADIEALLEINRRQLAMITELHRIRREVSPHAEPQPPMSVSPVEAGPEGLGSASG
jgi:uncharacterized membrane protein